MKFSITKFCYMSITMWKFNSLKHLYSRQTSGAYETFWTPAHGCICWFFLFPATRQPCLQNATIGLYTEPIHISLINQLNQLTNSMEQSPFWEANSCSAIEEIPCHNQMSPTHTGLDQNQKKPKGSLLCSQKPIYSYPELCSSSVHVRFSKHSSVVLSKHCLGNLLLQSQLQTEEEISWDPKLHV